MRKRFRSKRGEIFTEILISVLAIGIFTGTIFQAVLLMRQTVQRATRIDTYAAAAQSVADTIGTALWGTGLGNEELGPASFALSETVYSRLDSVSGARHVASFSYDAENRKQYTLSPKIEQIMVNSYSSGVITQKTLSIVTGFAVRVRVYYGDSENEYTEASLFSNVRGGDVDVL